MQSERYKTFQPARDVLESVSDARHIGGCKEWNTCDERGGSETATHVFTLVFLLSQIFSKSEMPGSTKSKLVVAETTATATAEIVGIASIPGARTQTTLL